jgi:hypothetical protein
MVDPRRGAEPWLIPVVRNRVFKNAAHDLNLPNIPVFQVLVEISSAPESVLHVCHSARIPLRNICIKLQSISKEHVKSINL